jgi:hypothetical protein
MLKSIVEYINEANKDANCEESSTNYVYICSKGTEKYPDIILNLKDKDGKV